MNDLESQLAAKIAIIKQEFLARLRNDWLPNLQRLRQSFLDAPADEALLTELMRAAHDMTGSGSVFGCDDISNVGRSLEQRLRTMIASDTAANEVDHREILALTDRLQEVCAIALRDAEPHT
jgi:chemotaxis protein histidine kinase CheA